ncbi:hypothetical protein C1H76_9071 [Elsinoe australis]|uniref:Uncharacterized protein n=1 Tax=Elsinoe australis TaxID=40998 RepID=A0A2P8AIB4_9PEZI|nr:hypothetical protein B9Z65_1113 [Elsinoe australis]TKX18810.1 hypothetical protein C1H76_9071 [Elsinoe australis]
MQYSVVAILALAGAAFASPAPQQVTVTASRTTVVTITTCGAAVTNCPARTETQVATSTYVYPAGTAGALYPSACATGGNCAFGTGAITYNVPQPTGGYKGPNFTGGAGQMKAGAALAGVGAVAALLL